MTPEIDARLDAYRSRNYSDEAVAHAKELVRNSRPNSPEDARSLCSRVAKFVDWTIEQKGKATSPTGDEVIEDVEILLDDVRINEYVASLQETKKTKAATRSALRRVRRALTNERTSSLIRNADNEEALPPYTSSEIIDIEMRAAADNDSLGHYSYRVTTALSLGAGLRPRETALVRGTDVYQRNGHTYVQVDCSEFPRTVRVDERFSALLLELAVYAQANLLVDPDGAGRTKESHERTHESAETRAAKRHASSTNKGATYVRLTAKRGRVTWLVRTLERNDFRLDELVYQAGLDSTTSLSRLFQFLSPNEHDHKKVCG